MRIAYLVALVISANVLTAPNGHAENSSATLQIGAVNLSATNQNGTNNSATATQSGALNGAAIVQTGSPNSATINAERRHADYDEQ